MSRRPTDLHGPRVLAWDACVNVRDLGGLPTRDGRPTRWGALVRADTLCRLTEPGREALRRHGVRTVIDLRRAHEVAAAPSPFAGARTDGGPVYLHLPLDAADVIGPPTVEEGYRRSLDAARAEVARVAAAVARAPAGGVLVHCHAGKDRTGIVVAILLALVGVPDELIVEDYVVLGDLEAQAGAWARWIVDHTDDPRERARLMRGAPPDPAVAQALLDHLHARHGGAEAYLLAGGARSEELAPLRERLLRAGA